MHSGFSCYLRGLLRAILSLQDHALRNFKDAYRTGFLEYMFNAADFRALLPLNFVFDMALK